MRHLAFVAIALSVASSRAGGIEEIRVADVHETIVLRSNGTGSYSYRGQWNWNLTDERVGEFRASFDEEDFRRLSELPAAAKWDEMKDFYIPYSTSIARTTIVRDGRSKTVELDQRGSQSDPQTPIDLWTLEMAVRGVASRLKWEPISSGVRVSVSGQPRGVREIAVCELGSSYSVAVLRTKKSEVEIPVSPGNYLVVVKELRDGRWEDLWEWWVEVPGDKYVAIAGEAKTSQQPGVAPTQELLLQTPNGWWLRCRSDGSGSLGHGVPADEAADFKPGTIDLAAALQELDKPSTDDLTKGYRFTVTTRNNGGLPKSRYSKDEGLVLGLFQKAAQPQALSRQGRRFAPTWKDHPPVLKS